MSLRNKNTKITPTDFEVCRGFVYSRDTLKPNALFVRVFTDARADIDEHSVDMTDRPFCADLGPFKNHFANVDFLFYTALLHDK